MKRLSSQTISIKWLCLQITPLRPSNIAQSFNQKPDASSFRFFGGPPGISPLEISNIATRNIAEALEMCSDTGSIETAKIAEPVVLGWNPIEGISKTRAIELVFKNGEFTNPVQG